LRGYAWTAGPAANNFLMQFQADILGVPGRTAEIIEDDGFGGGLSGRPGGLVSGRINP